MPVLGEMLPQVSVDLFTPCPVQMEYPNGDLHRLSNGCIYPRASARHTQCLAPVSLTGLISLILSILCAALNLVRGAHVVEHATQVGLWTWISLVTEISRMIKNGNLLHRYSSSPAGLVLYSVTCSYCRVTEGWQ
uniref:uncharacterized protein isoform X5 n=1 Tax=Myxine glutinosa TaxID=7769 RepID=UPI00358F100E